MAEPAWPPSAAAGEQAPLPGVASGLGLAKFRDRLRIPPVIRAWHRPANQPIRIAAERTRVRWHADLPEVEAWGYEGSVPGPTIEVLRGQEARIDWENALAADDGAPATLPFDVVRVPPLPFGSVPFNADFATAMRPGGRSTTVATGPDSYEPLPGTATVGASTVVHLHGALTDGHNDGWAHNVALPGRVTRCTYPNEQEATTLWYHDHAMAVTRFNVHAGLAGFYLIRDWREHELGLPRGEFEIPLTLGDRNLETDTDGVFTGRVLYKHSGFQFAEGGTVGDVPFSGPFHTANATIWPVLRARPRWYRFRLLNASGTRTLRLALHDTTDEVFAPDVSVPATSPAFGAHRLAPAWVVIGTDGGLLPTPSTPQDGLIEFGPGERLDVVVDLRRLGGRTLELRNENGTVLNAQPGEADATILQITVRPGRERDEWEVPRVLSQEYHRYRHHHDGTLGIGDEVVHTHEHVWVGVVPPGTHGNLHPGLWELQELTDGAPVPDHDVIRITRTDGTVMALHPVARLFDDPTTIFFPHGAWAVWHLLHLGGPPHPMHIHMTEFQMIARRQWPLGPGGTVPGFDPATGTVTDPLPQPGPGRPLVGAAAGMKDTWVLQPGEWVSVLGRFAGATGSFMYHCHILDHEDHTMMRPFVVMAPGVLPLHRGHGGGHH
ncbi:multicopper oxidase family protein [Propioniciclava soli]|uniref:Multicopper oxidase domain-containing protein n=1 Tax=Propioniciclava soli TaxID=2775081 RepID=A0ABZ3C3Q2_9ACTN